MKTTNRTTELKDRKVILSTLWIFALFNYVYANILTLYFNPVLQKEATKELLSGFIGSIQITQGFVLVGAIPGHVSKDLALIKDLLEAGKVVPVIERRYPLCETAEALQYLEDGHARGKVVITVAQTHTT